MNSAFLELAFTWVCVGNDRRSIVNAGRIQTKSKLVTIEDPSEQLILRFGQTLNGDIS